MNSKQNNNFKVSGVVHKYNKLDGQQITLFGYDEKNKYLIKKIDNFID